MMISSHHNRLSMQFRIFLDWNEQCGIPLEKMYELRDDVLARVSLHTPEVKAERLDMFIVCWETAVLYRKILNLHNRGLRCRILIPYLALFHCAIADKKSFVKKCITEQLLDIELHARDKKAQEAQLFAVIREAFASSDW